MGLINRLKRITFARVEAFLYSAEEPESMLPRVIEEMEDAFRAAANAEAKAGAALVSAHRRLDETQGKIIRLERGAELALSRGDEKTASEAIAEQVRTEKNIEAQQEAVIRSESALQEARETRAQLEAELAKLKSRGNEILARARSAQIRTKSHQALARTVGSSESILDQVGRLESRLDAEESRLEIRGRFSNEGKLSLDERLTRLARESEIEERLERMRKKSG